jgi:hypothetical protein
MVEPVLHLYSDFHCNVWLRRRGRWNYPHVSTASSTRVWATSRSTFQRGICDARSEACRTPVGNTGIAPPLLRRPDSPSGERPTIGSDHRRGRSVRGAAMARSLSAGASMIL